MNAPAACALAAGSVALLSLVRAVLPAPPLPPLPAVRALAPELRAAPIAAVVVGDPARGDEFLYARRDGTWRCLSTFGAVADDAAIHALVERFLEAHAEVRDPAPVAPELFGVGAERLTISFHGPGVLTAADRDRRAAFVVGAARDGRTFLQRGEDSAVLAVAGDLRAPLARSREQSTPPLLDRRLLAGPWAGRGFATLRIEPARGPSLVIVHEPIAEPGDGPPWRWILQVGDDDTFRDVLPERAIGYTTFLFRASWQGFANPAQAEELGLLPLAARVALTPHLDPGTAEIVLEVGASTPRGFTLVRATPSGMLCQVDAETARLLAPDAAMLTDPSIPNPYQLWLAR